MSIEQNGQKSQDDFNLELDAVRTRVASIDERLAALQRKPHADDGPPPSGPQTSQLLFENILVRLDWLQESVVLNRRLSALEAIHHRSA